MITLTFVNVVLRGLYTHAHMQWANSILSMADWGDPIARLMVLWLTFLGASLITSENRHINIDFISSLLPEKWLFLHKAILSTAMISLAHPEFLRTIFYPRFDGILQVAW